MNALLLLFATLSHAAELNPVDKALAQLEHVRTQQARVRAAHREARASDATATRCLARHRRHVRDLVWSAELLAADVRYAGELGYPDAPWESLVRLRGVVGRIDGQVSDAAACLGVEALPEAKRPVTEIELLPMDTELQRDGLFEGWQRPPEVQPFV